MEGDHGAMVELTIYVFTVSSRWLNDDMLCVMKLTGMQRVKNAARGGDWNEHGKITVVQWR